MAEEANVLVANSPENKPTISRQEGQAEADVAEPVKEGANGAASNGDDVETTSPDVATGNATIENQITTTSDTTNAEQTTSNDVTQDKPATTQEDIEMKGDTKDGDAAPATEGSAEPAVSTPASTSKSQPRRKSGGIPEHKGKKLNKKASKAKMTHTDAQPGDYFYVRLKGYPLWPAIVCDESMLPSTLLKNRPVTAARPDGTYRADYEDGGPKVKDRTFPVMYLHTNEFGFIPNYDLVEIDFDDVANVTSNMRKDLAEARRLAAEKHDLEYFKDILKNFMEQRESDRLAKEAAQAEKKAKKAAKKDRKSTATVVESDEDGDVEMADAIGEPDTEEAEPSKAKKNGNGKRENEDVEPRPESVKKPRIKLNTPKTINGTSTPKVAKDPAAPKSAKPKKKSTPKVKTAEVPEVVVPKEPELTPEEKRIKKEKEILFLRHKLQKGLLTRDQEPKAEEMKSMSEFVSKLEGYADLEVSIIRTTKINKVLKAILKLGAIPKEEEFKFKPRSQALLDKWNKLLASEQGTPAAVPATTNGSAAEAKSEVEEAKISPAEPTNGTKDSSADEKPDEKSEENGEEPSAPEAKDDPKAESASVAAEETAEETIEDTAPVEATA